MNTLMHSEAGQYGLRPQMQPKEIAVMEKILSSHGPHVDVLEWGSGGSTVYYTAFLQKKRISYTWTSVEYNKVWYERIADLVKDDANTEVILFDVGNNELRQRYTDMEDYITYPSTLGKKYDVIFVDGRKRRRCVLEASRLLKPDGVTILHDARSTHYHCAFVVYPDSRMLLWTGLWQGKLEDPGFIRRMVNIIAYWCFRMYTFSFRFIPRFLIK